MFRGTITAFVATIIAVACTTPDERIDSGVGGVTRLTVECAATSRTTIGGTTPSGDYLHHWQAGDCISINCVVSDAAEIDSADPRRASFEVSERLDYPYHLLHPASTDGRITFAATQHHVEGSFDPAAITMYGYTEQGMSATLHHLCSIIRLSLTGSVSLTSIEVTASEGVLCGNYAIDCASGTLSDGREQSHTIDYLFDSPLKLSDTPASTFIALPAGDHGTCHITLHDSNGGSMQLRFSTEGKMALRAGVVREFGTTHYRYGAEMFIEPLTSENDELSIFGEAAGYVRYADGTPIEGVAVSDGFQVVTTDKEGHYSFTPSKDTWHIFISLPADCRVPLNQYGQPHFYHLYEPKKMQRYDFTLERLEGGIEQEFMLYSLGDPQVSSANGFARFCNESVPTLRSHVQGQALPCYGIALGDIISSSTNSDKSGYMPMMRDKMAFESIGMPVFTVMGNHDHKGRYAARIDSRNSTLRLAAQRTYEECFGPANYSFNRGKVHIVSMMDIHYDCTSYDTYFDFESYHADFSDEQVEWLRQDLACVPKDRMVILCVHSQLNLYVTKYANIERVMTLLDDFAEARILAGHSHDVRNIKIANHNIVEHVTGALCGAWWQSVVARDGSPNGFALFHLDGAKVRNHVYLGINEGFNSPDYQIRLYRGSLISGGEYEYFASPYNRSTLLANVWNGGHGWQVDAYVGDKHIGRMTHLAYSLGDPWRYDSNGKKLTKDELNALQPAIQAQTSIENPTTFAANSTVDWWAIGYLIGVRGWSKRSQALSAANNMYHIESSLLADDKAWDDIRVVATDPYGNTYSCTEFIDGVVGVDFTYNAIVPPVWP